MECAYYFDICRLCHFGKLGLPCTLELLLLF